MTSFTTIEVINGDQLDELVTYDPDPLQDLLEKGMPALPLISACTCTLIAALYKGRKLFLHGRDMDAIYMVISRLFPQFVENGGLVYEVTSRHWIGADEPAYDTYHRRLALHDRHVPRIHVDTGFSGSVPHRLRKGGFAVSAIWLIGTTEPAKHRMMPLPKERRDYWRDPFDASSLWPAGQSDREVRYYLADLTERLPHELGEPEPGQTWEEYLEAQDHNPLFWRWVEILQGEVQREWAYHDHLYMRAVDEWTAPHDHYLDSLQESNKWSQMDPRVADAWEQPSAVWRACSGAGWGGLIHWIKKDLGLQISDYMLEGLAVQKSYSEQVKAEIFPHLNQDARTVYRIRLLRRFYNGSQTEKLLGRRMTPGEFRRWASKRDRFLEELQRQLSVDYGEVRLKGGWIYFLAP